MTSMDASPEPLGWGKWKRRLMTAVCALAVVVICVAIRAIGGREKAAAQTAVPGRVRIAGSEAGDLESSSTTSKGRSSAPISGADPAPMRNGNATSSQQQTVAVVNGEEIHRQELAQECLAEYGKDVLEAVMNKYLILTYCDKQGIKISKQDVDEEIARMAKQFSIPVDQWLQMLKQERGIKPEQYSDDIIMPTLRVTRKLAVSRSSRRRKNWMKLMRPSLVPAVKARLIVLDKADKAREVQAKARANPGDFEAPAQAQH